MLSSFFGRCFGIDDGFYETLAPRSPFTDDANVQFICPSCLNKPKEGSLSPDIANDLCVIKDSLCSISENQLGFDKKLMEVNKDALLVNHKMNDLFILDKNTNEICRKYGEKLQGEHRKPLFSDIAKSNGSFSPPITRASKRTRTETGPELRSGNGNIANELTPARPKPKLGALDAVIGPAVPQIVLKSGNMVNRRFDRSLWASRFHPETTVEQVLEYLLEKTGCNAEQLNCRKLVKKDADLASMQFVSFKIDANEDLFVLMDNPQIWPKYIMVREFTDERMAVQMRTVRLPELAEKNEPIEIDLTVDKEVATQLSTDPEASTSHAETTKI